MFVFLKIIFLLVFPASPIPSGLLLVYAVVGPLVLSLGPVSAGHAPGKARDGVGSDYQGAS